jgi:hypothetical protein
MTNAPRQSPSATKKRIIPATWRRVPNELTKSQPRVFPAPSPGCGKSIRFRGTNGAASSAASSVITKDSNSGIGQGKLKFLPG